ncbi:hypothetical protein GmHk_02G004446 [Glycine max]|nr:hypothetical protein GmHk_02G004446 [Glycine max]
MNSCFPSPDLGTNVIVTREQYFNFHNIDRQLFARFVVVLGRDTSQSAHVMAFIMWLEKQCKDKKMMKNMLQWPDTMLDSLADEAMLVLNCIESHQFPYDDVVNDESLPLIKSIMQKNVVSLKYFYVNHVILIGAVTRLLNNICVKAFTDIVQKVQYMKEQNLQIANIYEVGPCVKQVVCYTPMPSANIISHQVAILTPLWGEGSLVSWETNNNINPPAEAYDVANQIELNQNFNEVLAMLNQTSITTGTNDEKKEVQVPIDDRIIFMTFSKGYPISEPEVRDFITRYGDIIEAFCMQDVVPPEQPLYARLVIRAEAIHIIDHFLESSNKVKLSINGKHAWARKYFRKGNKSLKEKSPMTS